MTKEEFLHEKKSALAFYLGIFIISTIGGFSVFLLIGYSFHREVSWNLVLDSAFFGGILGNMAGFGTVVVCQQMVREVDHALRPLNLLRKGFWYFLISFGAAEFFLMVTYIIMGHLELLNGGSISLLFIFVLVGGGIGLGVTLLITSYQYSKFELEKSYERLKEKELLEKELQVARQVQAGFLPSGDIQIEGFDVSTFFKSAKEVGGDYFDVIPLKKGVGIVIADVSGKGVPAALVMANLHAALHVLAQDCPADELVSRINKSIFKDTSPDLFVTFFYGVLYNSIGEFRYVNAGHNPPLVVRQDGAVEKLTQGGIVLGIIPDSKFQTGSIILNSKDLLLLYTDGLTEAGLPEIEPWGEDNLADFLVRIHQKSADSITDLILKQVEESIKGVVQTDDIALVLLKRK